MFMGITIFSRSSDHITIYRSNPSRFFTNASLATGIWPELLYQLSMFHGVGIKSIQKAVSYPHGGPATIAQVDFF